MNRDYMIDAREIGRMRHPHEPNIGDVLAFTFTLVGIVGLIAWAVVMQ